MLHNFILGLQLIQQRFTTANMSSTNTDVFYIFGTETNPINENSFARIEVLALNERGWYWNSHLKAWAFAL